MNIETLTFAVALQFITCVALLFVILKLSNKLDIANQKLIYCEKLIKDYESAIIYIKKTAQKNDIN